MKTLSAIVMSGAGYLVLRYALPLMPPMVCFAVGGGIAVPFFMAVGILEEAILRRKI